MVQWLGLTTHRCKKMKKKKTKQKLYNNHSNIIPHDQSWLMSNPISSRVHHFGSHRGMLKTEQKTPARLLESKSNNNNNEKVRCS